MSTLARFNARFSGPVRARLAAKVQATKQTSLPFHSNRILQTATRAFNSDVTPDRAIYYAVISGDLAKVTSLVSAGVDINSEDYDKRSPLHLACAEGNMEMIEWMIANGADINARDRYKVSPLEDALVAGHSKVVAVLRAQNAELDENRKSDLYKTFLVAAAEDNVELMTLFVEAGISCGEADYDLRTPLHIAASEGQIRAVQFLLNQDVDPNPIDRFGNTPLMDSRRGIGQQHRAVEQILLESGAKSNETSEYSMVVSMKQSLPFLCNRGNFGFVEVFLPSRKGNEFVQIESFKDERYADNLDRILHKATRRVIIAEEGTAFGQALAGGKSVVTDNVAEELFDNRVSAESLESAGISSGVVVPLRDIDGSNSELLYGILVFYPLQDCTGENSDEFLEKFTRFASRAVKAGLHGLSKDPVFETYPDVPENQQLEVWRHICHQNVFNVNIVYNEVAWFYEMGMQNFYFQRFTSDFLARHIQSLIAAKQFALANGTPEKIWMHIENNPQFFGGGGPEQAIFMIPQRHGPQAAAERQLEKLIKRIPKNKNYELEMFVSKSPLIPRGSVRMALYVLQTHDFLKTSEKDDLSKETSIWKIATETFLTTKPKEVRERYEELVATASSKLSPVFEVYPEYKDGTIPIMIAVNTSNSSSSYMGAITELMHQNDIEPERKFIETFANGIVVYTFYVKNSDSVQDRISVCLKQFSMLHLLPHDSQLTPLLLQGSMTPEVFTYAIAVSRFVFYFLNQRSEEFEHLMEIFKNDPENMNRFRMLHAGMKREAASHSRIGNVIKQYPEIIELLSEDFKLRTTTNWAKDGEIPVNSALKERIHKEAMNSIDEQVMTAMMNFNSATLKTNLYKQRKASLSFRLDPNKLNMQDEWPAVPYGLFYVVSADFQGFHVRFSDVARGGIRLIQSRDKSAYHKNVSTQFAENFGLAYTQNLKNKDIPEFGSKGTILLNADSQENGFIAFKKYISGLVDLLVPNAEIVDNYGQEELLFLGPDEGTANMMQHAAEYSASKGYAYWRAFTTGKPPSMGGIPHDTYGMTTRSVHQYVLGCLRKLNWKEEEVTKIQTGGPDGDLGSNEILISKDKTKAIIDGSGVLYDPNGLDRQELTRLATERVMIENFDESYLGEGGFKILVNEKNVELPNGEVVESGLTFRNDFHLHPLCTADLFVPCGGRPESVNVGNVKHLFDAEGQPKFKVVVEGANLFFSTDARVALEKKGVVLFKDASTNKGGVTSSSLEVLAALALSESAFKKHMSVTDMNSIPEFYQKYVKEIQWRLEHDADLEFECIWKCYDEEKGQIPRHVLTDIVSDKINELNIFLQTSELYNNPVVRHNVMKEAIPKTIQELHPLDEVLERVPENYCRAIFAAYIASRYVYLYGTKGNEFTFFDFMQKFAQDSA